MAEPEKHCGIFSGKTSSGTYVNPNHFAGLLVLVIPLFLGYLLYLYSTQGAVPSRWGNKIKLPVSSHFITFFAVSLMGITLILAQSRGAILSFAASILFFYTLISKNKKTRSTKWLLGGFFLIIFVYSLWIGLDPAIDKITKTSRELPNRTYIWKDSINMIKDFPLAGVGLGNFSPAHTMYKNKAHWAHLYDHARNDYIELAAETGGLTGFIPVFRALTAFFKNVLACVRYISPQNDPFRYYILLGSICGMFGMFVHAITEFTFQIPANAYYFTFLPALTSSISNHVMERNKM